MATTARTYELTKRQKEAFALLEDPRYRRYLFDGGARSGKTDGTIAWLVYQATKYAGARILIARYRLDHARTTIWNLTLKKLLPPGCSGVRYMEGPQAVRAFRATRDLTPPSQREARSAPQAVRASSSRRIWRARDAGGIRQRPHAAGLLVEEPPFSHRGEGGRIAFSSFLPRGLVAFYNSHRKHSNGRFCRPGEENDGYDVRKGISIRAARRNSKPKTRRQYLDAYKSAGVTALRHGGLQGKAELTADTFGHCISSGLGRLKRTMMEHPDIMSVLFRKGFLKEEDVRTKRPDGTDYTNKENWKRCWHVLGKTIVNRIKCSYDFTVFEHKDNGMVEVYDFTMHKTGK